MKSAAIAVLFCLLVSGCTSKIDTIPHRQFLQDSITANGLYIKLGIELNDTWNAYVDGRLTDQQTVSFIKEIRAVEKRENSTVETLGNNIPTTLPGSDYPKIVLDLQTSASMVDNMCVQLLSYFDDHDATHSEMAQKYMIRLGVWVRRVNSDIGQEIDVLRAFEATK